MANTKGKIIIGAGIALVSGTIIVLVQRQIRQKVVLKKINKKLNDVSTQQGLSATLSEEDKHKANYGFDPLFWKQGKKGIMPDVNLLLPPKIARERAKKINQAVGRFTEDEDKIIGVIKQSESQGQLSQVAHAYQSGTQSYGNLADTVKDALKGTWYGSEDRLKELNNFINALPY